MVDVCRQTTSWWLQPNWKICSSNWIISPRIRGENNKYLSCHHLGPRLPWNLKLSWTLPFWTTCHLDSLNNPQVWRGNVGGEACGCDPVMDWRNFGLPRTSLLASIPSQKRKGPIFTSSWEMRVSGRLQISRWVFPKIMVSQNGWFIMENPIKMDDLGVPLFLETPRFIQGKWWLAKTFVWFLFRSTSVHGFQLQMFFQENPANPPRNMKKRLFGHNASISGGKNTRKKGHPQFFGGKSMNLWHKNTPLFGDVFEL